jgi:osmotically-inducible protein OsmY
MVAFEDSVTDADLDLARRVTTYLLSKQQRSLRSVEVQAHGGTVVLRGEVGSFYEKQLCLNCTRRVAGVASLVDEIQVSDYASVG